jgi:glycosyltransferase involved in cell wall biosynthesis
VKVVLLAEVFSRKMGYLGNLLPKYLARLGAEVHLITPDLPPYHRLSEFQQTYGSFIDPTELVAGTIEACDGFTLHVLAHRKVLGYMRMVGLGRKLYSIRPDIVQTMTAIGWIPLDAALFKICLGYKLFTANHFHASVFPLANKVSSPWSKEQLRCTVTRTIPGRLLSIPTEKCYAITSDCADVASRFLGVQKSKIDVCPLGVDTELFNPISNEKDCQARLKLRQHLGFPESAIVCIYTGRFSEDKNPLLLAKAVAHLVEMGKPFRGLFVGNGVQAQEIQSCPGCVAHSFVPVHELRKYFHAADIGVWPTQESTSMLDAAACGLPIIANHTMAATERLEGNGLTYTLNDRSNLVQVLLSLQEPQERKRLGDYGAHKMARDFSWEFVARKRLQDYQAACVSKRALAEKAVSKDLIERAD